MQVPKYLGTRHAGGAQASMHANTHSHKNGSLKKSFGSLINVLLLCLRRGSKGAREMWVARAVGFR